MNIQVDINLIWENDVEVKLFLEGDGFKISESVIGDKEPYYTFDYQVHRKVYSTLRKAGYNSRGPHDKESILHVLRLLRNERIDIGLEGEMLLSNQIKRTQ